MKQLISLAIVLLFSVAAGAETSDWAFDDAFTTEHAAPYDDLSREFLGYSNFLEIELPFASLSHVNLTAANSIDSSLAYVDLLYADLRVTFLNGTDLKDALRWYTAYLNSALKNHKAIFSAGRWSLNL
ncbi:MAG: hypothetical protein H8E62_07960 [Planctomycetes bacterium]|nr:hypothetical protein [Planctomycetota bacterium]